MSYDYDALVQDFWKARKAAKEATDPSNAATAWMEAVQAAETLSQHCPLTPLLWMQYAHAAHHISPELELPILQLGLLEFPGAAILHLRAVAVAAGSPSSSSVIDSAIAAVQLGSHRNQDGYVLQLFQHWLATSSSPSDVLVARSRVPMKHGNETLHEEALQYLNDAAADDDTAKKTLAALDEGRRWEARVLGSLSQHDDAIDAAMDQQGILDPSASSTSSTLCLDWDTVLENATYHMGLGGFAVARAFLQYAKEAQSLRLAKTEQFSTHQLAFAMYERGIAECPTVESLWVNYIVDLTRSPEGLGSLKSVTARAVRNCPYSIALAQHQLYATEKLATNQRAIVDPDELFQVAKDCLDRKFLPTDTAPLALFLSVTKVIKRRILWLIAQETETRKSKKDLAYDDAEPLPRKEPKATEVAASLSETASTEIEDLIADLRDLYDEAEHMLPNTTSKAEWRKDRATSETFLLTPLSSAADDPSATFSSSTTILKSFEMAVKAHSPPHPNIYLAYIQQYSVLCPVQMNPKDVLRRIRRVRFLFRSAVEVAGLKNLLNVNKVQYIDALKNLQNSWLEWEHTFGSERSVFRAKDASKRKLEKLLVALDEDQGMIPTASLTNGQKGQSHASPDTSSETCRPLKRQRTGEKKEGETNTAGTVTIGALEHPAHPFTVRVSNINPQSQDMDIVDVLRPKCGQIVHARIVRHKDSSKSKGWALVQFEEKSSVEEALALGGVVGLHEKLLTIERSQLPAVGIVPPGKHRVNPRGAGKSSKRNEKRRSRNQDSANRQDESNATQHTNTSNPLPFQPRSLARKKKPTT